MPLIRWDGGGQGRKVLKEQRVSQRRQWLEEVRLSELRQYRWELTEQPKEPSEQSKAPETSATLVDSSDAESMGEGHLPLQAPPISVWPEGRLDMEEPPCEWPWVPLDMDDTHKDQEPSRNKKWHIILKEGPPCSIDLDA
jgi:hypothetical protein